MYSNQNYCLHVCCDWWKWLCEVNSWNLHIPLNYIYQLQTDYSVSIFLTLEHPLCFYFVSLDQNPWLSWQGIAYFRNSWHVPQIFVWSWHCFHEYLNLSCARRNWLIARLLNIVFFVFCGNWNEYCVSVQFLFDIDDWIMHFGVVVLYEVSNF